MTWQPKQQFRQFGQKVVAPEIARLILSNYASADHESG
jgi:hypothetical protein